MFYLFNGENLFYIVKNFIKNEEVRNRKRSVL